MSIGVVLTSFRRPQYLGMQIQHVQQQTVPPDDIVVFHNGPASMASHIVPEGRVPAVRVITSSSNLGVWARFLMAMELETEYVAIFDDDTIPGAAWFENCLATMARGGDALLGAQGVRFAHGKREQRSYVGNTGDFSAKPTEYCDIVGHGWFLKRDWLRYFALEPRLGTPRCGEDYHLSFALQKHLGLPTAVPPRDGKSMDMYGSLWPHLGADDAALYLQEGEDADKKAAHEKYVAAGWQPIDVGYTQVNKAQEIRNALKRPVFTSQVRGGGG